MTSVCFCFTFSLYYSFSIFFIILTRNAKGSWTHLILHDFFFLWNFNITQKLIPIRLSGHKFIYFWSIQTFFETQIGTKCSSRSSNKNIINFFYKLIITIIRLQQTKYLCVHTTKVTIIICYETRYYKCVVNINT